MEKEHLHLLINEEIYLLPKDGTIHNEDANEKYAISEDVDSAAPSTENQSEELDTEKAASAETEATVTQVSEPEAEILVKQEKEPIQQESPHIPIQEVEEPSEIPFAIFHSSTVSEEHELLQKIIDACKIPSDDYKIFGNGFDQSVKFKKALVFVPEAKAFYNPIPYKGSEFLCSKPLELLASNKQEKALLWNALQKFI